MKTPFLLALILFITKIGECQCATTSSSITISACSTYHWAANNATYTISGIYAYTSLNAAGCDSLQTLNLSINNPNQWTWVSGTNNINQFGIYGTKGIPSPANQPGSRDGAINWTDNAGNLWLFGGWGKAGSGYYGFLNDLWKYNISSGLWTWISGDSIVDEYGIYGTKGVASPTNKPGARGYGVSFIDNSGNLWLFGGNGFGYTFNANGNANLNDLWKFNPVTGQWTWISGDNLVDQYGIYGTKGIASSTNKPGARQGAVGNKDNSGNLWIFGGIDGFSETDEGELNDLWKFNISSGLWTWVSGDNSINTYGNYGTKLIASISNKPGGRGAGVCWVDSSNNFWLFGGHGYTSNNTHFLNDLWKFNPVTGQWTWMSGDNLVDQYGIYGTKGIASANTKPGARFQLSGWIDNTGNLWLTRGSGYSSNGIGYLNDMFKYNINTGNWTWMDGDNITGQQGIYGTKGISSSTNKPGGRQTFLSWIDNFKNIWLFGGYGLGNTSTIGQLNDLWKYTPPCNSITSSSNLTVCNSYTWNGTTYTTSGAYTQTYLSTSGIDSVHTLNLTINYSTTNGNATVTACDSYLWNGVTYTSSGTYTYTSLNTQGCVNTAILNLTINPTPIANAGADQTILSGSIATLTANGGGTYLWSTGETNSSITVTPSTTTTYTVTVTNNYGCSTTDIVQVNVLFNSLSVTPASYDYGNVVVGYSSVHNLTITNNGTSPITIDSLPDNFPFASLFVSQTLNAGSTINIPITFNANAALIYSKILTFYTSIGNFTFQRTGKGVAPAPAWTITPNNYTFGNVNLGNISTFNFTITNTGNIPISIGTITATNPVFAVNTSASNIAVGSNATFTISFEPSSIVSYNGVVNINSLTVGLNPLTLTLNGNGIVQGTPPVLKFVTNAPYNNVSGVNPQTGFPGTYTYQVLYKSSTNLLPQAGYPKLGIDKNGDGDFTDGSEGVFTMSRLSSGTPDYINGEIFSFTTTLSIGAQYGYQFIANDSLGNPAVGINTGYSAGPMVTNETLDLSIYANDITFSIPNPAVSQPFTIYATVHNSSPYPASNVNIKFYKDSIYLTSTVVPFIDANSDAVVSFNWSFATDGWYPIKVWIDSGGALGETNPLNNYAIRPITVGQFSLPGSILINATASPQSCPVPGVMISGSAIYDGLNLAVNPPVLGANVTIVINGETLQTTTGFNGYYSIFYNNNGAGIPCNTSLQYSVIVTDFTFTSTTINQSVNIPCIQCGNGSGAGYYSFVSNASTPQCLIELTPINYQVHIFNYGTLNSYLDTIKVFAEGNLINTLIEDSIVIGQTKNYNNSVTLTSGAHTMSFIHTYYDVSNNVHNESFSNTIYVQPNLPDLYLGTFYQSGPTAFHVTNYNGNCASSGASKIYIYDSMNTYNGEVLIDSINTTGMSAWGYEEYYFNKSNWTKGYHYIRLKTDAPLIISETNENNNLLSAVIYVPFSELSVGAIDASNSNVTLGSQVNFSAVIQNSGASCGSFKVRFLANSIPVGNDIIVAGGMNANSNQLVTSDIYTITNSSCPDSISVIVDADNTITELYENNNIGTYLFGRDFTSGVPYFGMGSFFNPYVVQVLNPVSLSTVIHNIGSRDASDVKVSFTLNGNMIGIDTIPALGASTNLYSSVSHIFSTAGNYVIQVSPDFDNTQCEMNESNNVGEIYVTVYGLPDLQILSQDVSPSGLNPAPGQNISIVSSVHSVGIIPSGPTTIRFYVDNVQLGNDVIIDSLYPGQDTTVECTALYSSMVVGPKIIKVKADVFNSMNESIESNNEATRTIIVGGAPDFAHSVHQSISFSQPIFRKGDNIQVCNFIRNYGGDTGTAWIKFYEQSNGIVNLIDSVQFTLKDHDSNQICVNWTVSNSVGQIITKISGSNPPEYNVLNNDDSLSFTAGPKLLLNASMTPSGIALGASSLATCASLNDGQAVTYQWYKNGIQINGNSLNYTISNATIADAGYYVLKGTDTFGTKSSNTVTLTVDNYLTPTMTVPVVVHVMNTGEPIGTESNPSDEEIKASIDFMNTEYNGTAAGTELGVGNTFIQFALAKRSPNDSCTNGITRHNLSANTSYNDYGVKFAFNGNTSGAIGMNDIDLKNTVRWDPTKYVNIWLVTKINGNTGNIFITPSNNGSGYVASLGDYQSDIDGIVLKSWFVHYTPVTTNVSNKTQIAHEMGHILNLYHVFEGNCPISSQCSSNGDYICDTDPVTKIDGLSPRTGINTCNGNPFSDYTERNIMSYTTEPSLFTPDQRTRMHDALTTLSYRMSLVNTATNNSLVSPLADLIITNPSASTIPVNANSLLSVSFSEKNIGGVTAVANYVNIHLSNDNVLTPGQNGDVYLGQYLVNQAIAPNTETTSFTTQVLIPATVTAGSYYVFFAADAQGQQVNECIEDNNFAMTNINILDCTTTSSQYATVCDSYIWACNGITYTSSGTYTCTSLNANGCVNNSYLNLTINQSTASSTNIFACGSYTWAASGLTYSTTGSIYKKQV